MSTAAGTRIEIRRGDAPIGAEVVGVDLSRELDAAAFERVRNAYYEHSVIVFRDQQLTLAKKADTNSQRIESIDQVRVEACQNQLAKADAEIGRLRNPGFFASLFDKRTLSGAIVGFGVGRATANQNPFVR